MKDMVVPDVMNDVFLPQGRYPENFVCISLCEVCQEGEFMTGDMEDMVVPDVMNDVFYPKDDTQKVSC